MARGWCPGVFTPMEAPDGLLVRVKPRLSRLDAAVARRIAEAAAEYGNGRIELTSRANLQLRGLTAETVGPFAHAMVACGAADPDAATERRRNIIVSPLAGDDPSIRGRPEVVAAMLEHGLADANDLALPDKFGFAVDGGGVLPLGETGADITVFTGAVGCEVRIAGAVGAVACRHDEAADVALALARAFLLLGGRRRMRDLVGVVGEQAIYTAAGFSVSLWPGLTRPSTRRAAMDASVEDSMHGGGPTAWVAGSSPAKVIDCDLALIAAANLAAAIGDGTLCVTPWRTLLIGGVLPGHARIAA